MSLAPRERQALAGIENSLSSSDPRLATMLATFTLPAFRGRIPGWKSWVRRTLRAKRFIVAAAALIAICVIVINGLLSSGHGHQSCEPDTRVITSGQTLTCPPAAGAHSQHGHLGVLPPSGGIPGQ